MGKSTRSATAATLMKGDNSEEDVLAGRLRIRRRVNQVRMKIREAKKWVKFHSEQWLRPNEVARGSKIRKTQRPATLCTTLEAELLMKKKNYQRISHMSLLRNLTVFGAPLLLLISLILPLASSNSTPPSPQTIEGKQSCLNLILI